MPERTPAAAASAPAKPAGPPQPEGRAQPLQRLPEEEGLPGPGPSLPAAAAPAARRRGGPAADPLLRSIFSTHLWRATGLEPKVLGTRRVFDLAERAEAERRQKEEARRLAAQRKAERAQRMREAKLERDLAAVAPKLRRAAAMARFEKAEREAQRLREEREEEARLAKLCVVCDGDLAVAPPASPDGAATPAATAPPAGEAAGRPAEAEAAAAAPAPCAGAATVPCAHCNRSAHRACCGKLEAGDVFTCAPCKQEQLELMSPERRPQRAAAPAAGTLRDKHSVPYSAILPGPSRPEGKKAKDSSAPSSPAVPKGEPSSAGAAAASPRPRPSPKKAARAAPAGGAARGAEEREGKQVSSETQKAEPKTPERGSPAPPSSDTKELNDEQLAMLLHQELNAPSSRRRGASRSNSALNLLGSPRLGSTSAKRKRDPAPYQSPDSPLCPPPFDKGAQGPPEKVARTASR